VLSCSLLGTWTAAADEASRNESVLLPAYNCSGSLMGGDEKLVAAIAMTKHQIDMQAHRKRNDF